MATLAAEVFALASETFILPALQVDPILQS